MRIFFPQIVISLGNFSFPDTKMTTKKATLPRELTSPSAQFEAASESIGLYWWHWDHRTKKITLSPGLMKILGYTPESFNGELSSLYKNIHPDDIREEQ